MSTTNLLDAIRIVIENEKLASDSYAEAARIISNPFGKQIFEELAAFEQYHFEQLTALVTSLEESGQSLDYQGRDFPTPPVFEIKAAEEPKLKSVIKIITEAMDLEKEAELAYAKLALRAQDSQAYGMFRRLSAEENMHWRILQDAYWTLTNLGTWTWIKP
jgi:rubrerythrin